MSDSLQPPNSPFAGFSSNLVASVATGAGFTVGAMAAGALAARQAAQRRQAKKQNPCHRRRRRRGRR